MRCKSSLSVSKDTIWQQSAHGNPKSVVVSVYMVFRARMASKGGRKVIKARRSRGRHQLTVTPAHVKKVNWKA
jgi:ribosomal protein L34